MMIGGSRLQIRKVMGGNTAGRHHGCGRGGGDGGELAIPGGGCGGGLGFHRLS